MKDGNGKQLKQGDCVWYMDPYDFNSPKLYRFHATVNGYDLDDYGYLKSNQLSLFPDLLVRDPDGGYMKEINSDSYAFCRSGECYPQREDAIHHAIKVIENKRNIRIAHLKSLLR